MRSHYLTIISCMAAGLLSSCAEPSLSKGAAAMPSLRFLAIGENSDFSAPTKAVEIASSDVAGRELSVTIDTTNFAMNSQGTWHVIVEELLSENPDKALLMSLIHSFH